MTAGKGDLQAMIEVIREVKAAEIRLQNGDVDDSAPKDEPKIGKPTGAGVYLDALDTEKALFQADSCIEFMLLSFCASFELKPKQAAGLLAQNNKFLFRILTKGLKSDFDPVLNWFQSIYQNTERICDLMMNEADKNSLAFVFTCLKPGLESKSAEVVKWAFKVYTKLALDLEERGGLKQAWTWFVQPSKGALGVAVEACKRLGKEVYSNAVEMLLHIAQFNLIELFSMHMKNLLSEPQDYFSFLSDILPALKETEWAAEEITSSRILNYWVESAGREADGYQSKARLTSLHFLCTLWTQFFLTSEEAESNLGVLLSSLKRGFRDQSIIIKATALGLMMELLDLLAEARNAFAPVIYKTLTMLLMEAEPGEDVRELMMQNFKRLLVTTPTIPVSILIEPLCKRVILIQIQITDGSYPLRMSDFDLFSSLARHSRLVIKNAIQLIDVLGKIYLSDMIYSKAAMSAFCVLVTRYVDAEAMQDYLGVFVKFGMGQVLINEKSRREKKAKYDKYPSYATEEVRQEILLLRRKRDVILEMTEWLLQLQQEELNQRLRDLIVSAHLDFRQANGTDCKGIVMLLRAFGDPQTVVQVYTSQKQKSDPQTGEVELMNRSDFVAQDLSEPKENRAIVQFQRPAADQKKPFPWKRAFADIEQAKKKAKEREQKLREEEEFERKRQEIKQGKIAQQLEVRKVEQAVTRVPASTELALYNEGVATKLISQQEEIVLKEFSEEEKDDQDAVNLIIKKYSRVFKVLFQKYAGTGFARKKEAALAFDWLAERKTKVADTAYIKLFSDHNIVPKLISKEEVRAILKVYCAKVAHQTELNSVDFDGFVGCFCQFAYFMFSREPQDYSHLQPVVSVKALIDTFRKETRASGHSTELFDDPDPGTGDKDVVKQLTKLLSENPETVLPPEYKRVADQDLSISFSVPEILELPEALTTALEILDDSLYTALQIHILEPRINYFTVYRAKGIASQKKEREDLPPIHERPPSLLKRKIKEYVEDVKPKEKPKNQIHLSPLLKLQVAQCQEEDKPRVKECAELLEDILHSLSLKMTRVIVRDSSKLRKPKATTPEPSSEDKVQAKAQGEKMKEQRKARQQALLGQLQKAMEEKQKRKADKVAVEKLEREKEKQRAKILAGKIQKEREERGRLFKDWHDKKSEEDRKKLEEETRVKATSDEKTKKMKEGLKRKMQERLKEVLMKKQQHWQQTKKPTVNANGTLMTDLAESKKRFEKMIKEDRKRLDERERRKEEFRTFSSSPDVVEVISTYSKHLETVFSFYCKQSLTKLEQRPEDLFNEMKLPDFIKFLNQFSVTPTLLSADNVVTIFNSITKMKFRNAGMPATLTYDEFQIALLRLVDEARAKLNLLSESGTSGAELREALVANQLGKEKTLGGEVLGVRTIRTFMIWLDFNLSIKELMEKLKQAQSMTKHPRKPFLPSASVESLKADLSLNKGSPLRMSQQEPIRKTPSPKRSPRRETPSPPK